MFVLPYGNPTRDVDDWGPLAHRSWGVVTSHRETRYARVRPRPRRRWMGILRVVGGAVKGRQCVEDTPETSLALHATARPNVGRGVRVVMKLEEGVIFGVLL